MNVAAVSLSHSVPALHPSLAPTDPIADAVSIQAAKNEFVLGAVVLKNEQELFNILMDALDQPHSRRPSGSMLDVTV